MNKQSFHTAAEKTMNWLQMVKMVLEPLHGNGIKVVFYLDNLILMAQSKELAALHTLEITGLCHKIEKLSASHTVVNLPGCAHELHHYESKAVPGWMH